MSEINLEHHEINYIEIPVSEISSAKAFYRSAFGWQFNDYGPEYAGIRKRDGSGEIGGFCKADHISPGGLLVILYSQDLESSLVAVQDAGGQITKSIFSFPGGRRFQFRDPSGHELAVWSNQEPDLPGGESKQTDERDS